jgi:DHA1 family multidrug resistance protein-like MFS transporter
MSQGTPLRNSLVAMSALAALSDAVLIAFYPQFFAERYGVRSELHAGLYVGAISLAVMASFPLWARVARRVETMPLLVFTQAAAGMLCLLGAWAPSLAAYWVLSMAMFVCKSSYLLMYPYLMRLQRPEAQAGTVGLLAVVVHVAGIAGAAAGGTLLQRLGPQACMVLMAAGDFAQMALCLWLLRAGSAPRVLAPRGPQPAAPRSAAIWRLALVMLLFDFSAYLVRPFFTEHWERLVGDADRGVAGLVFAIPAAMALLGLALQRRGRDGWGSTPANLLLGTAGLVLQALPSTAALLAGRCLFGWALFQVSVKLEVSVFRLSRPESYAGDYALTNFFQNLGVLAASFAAGAWMPCIGMPTAFLLAAGGWLLTALLDRWSLRVDRLPIPVTSLSAQHAH